MSTTLDDDDVEVLGGIYENGHWAWDDKYNELVFRCDLPEQSEEAPQLVTVALGSVEFKEDIDLVEQQRFRKRIQRKVTEDNNVVTLQDIKDIVLFSAPFKIVKPYTINLLHLPATERILRALILFCQYYLQISDIMSTRTAELLSKIRTSNSDQKELLYMENLEDLRLLVAKEYSNMINGSGVFAKFHHMGPSKKTRSMNRRDRFLFQTFIRISIQIIWIALGRKSFSQIELEVNRIFKLPLLNSEKHNLDRNDNRKEISANKYNVLLGRCLRKKYKVDMLSPLMNEVYCSKTNTDHRIYGLGIVKYPRLTSRLYYMECALSLPENMLQRQNISLGILGLPRSRFDILLKEICVVPVTSSTSGSNITLNVNRPSKSPRGQASQKKSAPGPVQIYKDVELPPKGPEDEFLSEFPTESYYRPRRQSDDVHRKKWLLRYIRIQNKHHRTQQYTLK